MSICVAVAAIGMCVVVGSVAAHDHATGVVKERMDAMERMAKAMKAIAQNIKASRNLASIKNEAQTVHDLAEKITPLFPAGSTGHPSGAKPIIWKQWPDFEAKARALASESQKLAAVDAVDSKSLAAQARAVSQTCGGCHELYRQKH
jgi:cytochrome c556